MGSASRWHDPTAIIATTLSVALPRVDALVVAIGFRPDIAPSSHCGDGYAPF
jgi:hypothetical protein